MEEIIISIIYLIFSGILLFLLFGLIIAMISYFRDSDDYHKSYLKYLEKQKEKSKPDHTGFVPYTQEWKDQHLKWASEGLCAECGEPSGEEKGICDKCRWS